MRRVEWGNAGGFSPVERPATKRDAAVDFEQTLDLFLEKPLPKGPVEAENVPDGVKFSRHAQARLQSRGKEFTPDEMRTLEHAMDELSRRGAKESLVLMGDRALVVGVPSKTVITIVDRAEALGTVFTNIDSTYVAS